jgi:hypothetical protein
MLQPSYFADPADKTIIIRFNHTELRELYENKKMIGGVKSDFYTEKTLDNLIVNDIPNDNAGGC